MKLLNLPEMVAKIEIMRCDCALLIGDYVQTRAFVHLFIQLFVPILIWFLVHTYTNMNLSKKT